MIRSLLNTINWCNPRLIPQRPGFRFTARLKDGRQVACETFRREFAIRVSVRSLEGDDIEFNDIQDWAGF